MEYHKENQGPFQLGQTKGTKVNYFSDIPADAKIRFLPTENYGFPRYVSLEEGRRLANWNSDCKCPLCEAGIPLKKDKDDLQI